MVGAGVIVGKKEAQKVFLREWVQSCKKFILWNIMKQCVNINRSSGHIIEYCNSNRNYYAFGHCSQRKNYMLISYIFKNVFIYLLKIIN